MDTPTAEVSLRVLDPSNKRNSRFFKQKSVPRFGNVLELKQFILEHNEGDALRRKITSFELGYFAGNHHFNVVSERPCWWTKTIDCSLAAFVHPPAIVHFSIVICVLRDCLQNRKGKSLSG